MNLLCSCVIASMWSKCCFFSSKWTRRNLAKDRNPTTQTPKNKSIIVTVMIVESCDGSSPLNHWTKFSNASAMLILLNILRDDRDDKCVTSLGLRGDRP